MECLRTIALIFTFALMMTAQNRTSTLYGRWAGERPTDEYVWRFLYTFEFFPGEGNGGPNFGVNYRYSYTVQQVSEKRPRWSLKQTGTFSLRQTDSKAWNIIMELRPDPGSQAPPTEQDREALVVTLGLPDDHVRAFRVRPSLTNLCFQLSDAPIPDSIPGDPDSRTTKARKALAMNHQSWYLEPKD